MSTPTEIVAQVNADLRALLSGDTIAELSDADRYAVLVSYGEVLRLVDACIAEAVATAGGVRS